MTSLRVRLLLVGLMLFMAFAPLVAEVNAQDDLVAALEVIDAGVQVKRVDTANWVPVRVETLIGPGDVIRTDATGQARITFFADGTQVNLEPETEYRIIEFSGDEDEFTLTVEVLAGITRQQFERLVGEGSSYTVVTPGAAMTVRGTDFAIRVEHDGRSSVLTYEGLVAANEDGEGAEVPPNFGLRAEVDKRLSDVVPATTFEELDFALDGCPGTFDTAADVNLNVRLGPGAQFDRVGTIPPAGITNIIGVNEGDDWYRIPFRDGYGWVYSATMTVDWLATCSLAVYPDGRMEDISRYALVGNVEINGFVAVEVANMRGGPGTAYDRVAQLTFGDELIITGRTEDQSWLRVRTLTGLDGWMAAFLVDVEVDLGQIGMVDSTPGMEDAEATPEAAPEEDAAEDAEVPADDDDDHAAAGDDDDDDDDGDQ